MISTGSDELVQRSAFESELMDGETIQWVGQPDPSVIFSKADIFFVPFSLIYGGFTLFWEATAMGPTLKDAKGGEAPLPFVLSGLPFIAGAIYLILGRFFYKAWRKRRTYYAVTDKRVLTLILTRGRHIQAMFIHDIPMINKYSGSRGTGSVIFGNTNWQNAIYANSGLEWLGGYNKGTPTIAFYDIKDADTIYELVNRAKTGTSGSRQLTGDGNHHVIPDGSTKPALSSQTPNSSLPNCGIFPQLSVENKI